jgi:hypothetical protein
VSDLRNSADIARHLVTRICSAIMGRRRRRDLSSSSALRAFSANVCSTSEH